MSRCFVITLYLIFVSKISCSANHHKNGYNCRELMGQFSDKLKDFTVQVSLHTEPFEVCMKSGEMYREMMLKYQELMETTDFHNENCKIKFLGGNKMIFLEVMKDHADQLWNTAHCYDCYDSMNDYNQPLSISNNTREFNNFYYQSYNECLHDYQNLAPDVKVNTTECKFCQEKYQMLNNYFDAISKFKKGEVCFDLTDLMNKTRFQWSSEFKCSQQKKDSMTNFLFVVVGVAAGLCLFYGSLYIKAIRDEARDPTILDAFLDSEVPGLSGQRNIPPEAVAGPSGAKDQLGSESDDDMLSFSSHSTNASLINIHDTGNSTTGNLITI